PTAKYLKYLHDNHKISLDYVFGGSMEMFRNTGDEENPPPDFGRYKEDVDELNQYMAHMPPALFAVLGFFSEYKMKNRQLIKEYYPQTDNEKQDE
ncbi:MAG: hypothetical protein GY940_44295, partial [bacterium]|nr:hypothetical protein [bacterium]